MRHVLSCVQLPSLSILYTVYCKLYTVYCILYVLYISVSLHQAKTLCCIGNNCKCCVLCLLLPLSLSLARALFLPALSHSISQFCMRRLRVAKKVIAANRVSIQHTVLQYTVLQFCMRRLTVAKRVIAAKWVNIQDTVHVPQYLTALYAAPHSG